ncbi:hypothetical protein KI387_014437, partial [Taxus chinensis]
MALLHWTSLLLLADQKLNPDLHMSTSSKRLTKSNGKEKLTEEEMKYRYQRVKMPESHAECDLDIRDSELGHIDMDDFWARPRRVTGNPWMEKLVGSGMHFSRGIPVSVVNNEFMMVVAHYYNKDIRCFENEKGEVIINLIAQHIKIMLSIPHHRHFVAVIQEDYTKAWEENEDKCMQLMNEVYLKNKK